MGAHYSASSSVARRARFAASRSFARTRLDGSMRGSLPRRVGMYSSPDPAEAGGFIVRGEKPERWIRQTAFDNDEAVGYLADRLAKIGVEKALAEAGAEAGAEVTIGDVTFDWQPSLDGAAMPGPRGTDRRLDGLG